VDHIDRAIGQSREAFDSLLVAARAGLQAGAPIARVHAGYVVPAFALLEEAEAAAVLVAAGDAGALSRLSDLVGELQALYEALLAEFPG
jgi:hypothetical protein